VLDCINRVPGTYTISESALVGNAEFVSLSCDDANSTVDQETRTATIHVDPNETVGCVWVNQTPSTEDVAHNVVMTDQLPAGSGIAWSLEAAIAGCDIQVGLLTCTFEELSDGETVSVHVSSPTTTASCGEYENNAVASADDRAQVEASASINVVCPAVEVSVTKTPTPMSVVEPGGNVTFAVAVNNDGQAQVTLTTLNDDQFGDLDGSGSCTVPQTIASGESYSCSFQGAVTGNAGDRHADIVTACVSDATDAENCVNGEASVDVRNAFPTLSVAKTPDRQALGEPGGPVQFSVEVENASVATDPVTLASIDDSVYGDVADSTNSAIASTTCAVPQTIASGASYTCSFTAMVTGAAGSSHTDTVTACGTDDETNETCADGGATVRILASTSQLTPTGTECADYAAGRAIDQEDLLYQLKGSKITSVTPGVVMYWTTIKAPSAAFTISVSQTGTTTQGAPSTAPLFTVNSSGPKLFDARCSQVKITIRRAPRGQTIVNVTGATAGATYYFTTKYDSNSISGTSVSLNPEFRATYGFSTLLDGALVVTSHDSLLLHRK
jgi:hypothetical protein